MSNVSPHLTRSVVIATAASARAALIQDQLLFGLDRVYPFVKDDPFPGLSNADLNIARADMAFNVADTAGGDYDEDYEEVFKQCHKAVDTTVANCDILTVAFFTNTLPIDPIAPDVLMLDVVEEEEHLCLTEVAKINDDARVQDELHTLMGHNPDASRRDDLIVELRALLQGNWCQ